MLTDYRRNSDKRGLLSSGVVLNDDVLTKTLSETESEKSTFDPDQLGHSVADF